MSFDEFMRKLNYPVSVMEDKDVGQAFRNFVSFVFNGKFDSSMSDSANVLFNVMLSLSEGVDED